MSARQKRSGIAPHTGLSYAEEDPEVARLFGRGPRGKERTKLKQLCRQVERAAWFALREDPGGEALDGACVLSVDPAPDQSRLRVVVAVPGLLDPGALARASRALAGLRASVRREAAALLHRKRVPEVVLEVAPWPEGGP